MQMLVRIFFDPLIASNQFNIPNLIAEQIKQMKQPKIRLKVFKTEFQWFRNIAALQNDEMWLS